MIKVLCFVLFTVLCMSTFAKSISELEISLDKAQTNNAMKKAARELKEGYLKEIKSLSTQVKKNYKGETLKSFQKAEKEWSNYFGAEEDFVEGEFSQYEKYGTSGGLSSKIWQNKVLKQRYLYLKELVASFKK